jgi:hypothetical protein
MSSSPHPSVPGRRVSTTGGDRSIGAKAFFTSLTPHDRAAALGDATVYRIDIGTVRGFVGVVAKVNSFKPDECGMVHLIGAQRIIEAEEGGEVIGISLVPLVAYSECTTTRVRADMIYACAVAAPNISQAFFSKMRNEIAGDLNDINYEREKLNA